MNDMSATFRPRPSAGPAKRATAQDFKDAMSRLAVGVGIAAGLSEDGSPVGLLVSSIAAVSAEPPRILFCVPKTVRSYNTLLRAHRLSLNILAESDRTEAERFSSAERAIERFDPSIWKLDPGAPPRHRAALVGLSGAVGHRLDAGTHTVFILNVDDVSIQHAGPLVYFDRRYASLRPLADA